MESEASTTVTKNIAAARVQQLQIAQSVSCHNDLGEIQTIAGVDVSCNPWSMNTVITAAVVVLSAVDLQVQQVVSAQTLPTIPYVPGLLAFREVPAVLLALQKLTKLPDLFFVDGHGFSHPKHCGIASHLGVMINKPTLGVAKSILIGKAAELAPVVGAEQPLIWQNQTIAMLLRSRLRARPIIISAGHKIDLTTALSWVKKTLRGYRLPEPTRLARFYSNQARKAAL
jgi:deoxyribonuclease V